jgi:hypothetical protein
MPCPVHPLERALGQCEICGQEVCALCPRDVSTPLDFECYSCGDMGTIALYETLRRRPPA